MNIIEQKVKLREQLKSQLANLPKKYLTESSIEICQKVLELPQYIKAEVVFTFVGVGEEITTWPIIEDSFNNKKRVVVPKCISKGIMEAYEITNIQQLVKGKFGLLEPEANGQPLAPEEIEFALIPCLSCNLQGYRLGWGRGYYDRFLARAYIPKAVVCREQMLYQDIPMDQHDIPIEMLITELKIYQTRR